MAGTDVVIVGAGVVGTALAAALRRRGRSVTLLEAGEPGGGTSATSFAWINSHKKTPLDYHALNLRGVEAWRRIAAEAPDAVAFTGHVSIAVGEAHRASLTQRTERLIGLGYEARWATPAEARARTPVPVPDDALVAIFDGEGHAFPRRWIARLAPAVTPARATRVEAHDAGATVHLADGGRVRAESVVICAGTGTAELVASAGGALPLVPPVVDSPAFGYLTDVAAPGHGITTIVKTDRLGLRPGEDGTLLVQALDLDGTADPRTPPPATVAAEIERRVAAVLPHTRPRVIAVRAGHRVIPADGRTAAGRIAPGSPVWAIATHSGITLAPWLAEVIAGELCGGPAEPLLSAFRPDRFHHTGTHDALAAPRAPGDQ
ncbi:NAD(P)/FAD-dependent oxidoreductase [Catenuloplanes atrovinosus]|uniref:Glycine/D-amino acid oxidase-like deaminating enzyme n=1 Tax=Catenuloplanes atrovinosus TaxID=137266 RepID=A0AAE3YT48_9ACTN|nr:FAD-binding oxidoreductase [Catenuloplanes atrovinosus]MDR7277386.1 glycine/D-amino acid oxidase-like deaminating enzyme [Catenuloplanes atrovinosus]